MQRPELPDIIKLNTLDKESFQNSTLRPIIKMLNAQLLQMIKCALKTKNKDYQNLQLEKQELFIQKTISKDIALNNILKGMIIGQMTEIELKAYLEESKEQGRRIIQIVTERFISQTLKQ